MAVGGLLAAAAVGVFLWPASDPLAGVERVAIRSSDWPTSGGIDWDGELRVVLGDRDIRIVSDPSTADVILELTEFALRLADVELSVRRGAIRGRASAVCTLTDVKTGEVHVMDFVVTVEDGVVRADLVPRRFWEFWKRS